MIPDVVSSFLIVYLIYGKPFQSVTKTDSNDLATRTQFFLIPHQNGGRSTCETVSWGKKGLFLSRRRIENKFPPKNK